MQIRNRLFNRKPKCVNRKKKEEKESESEEKKKARNY